MLENKYITFERAPFFQIAKDYLMQESKVLDVGCGKGEFSKYCNRSDFYLFDGNTETVNKLREVYSNVFLGKLPDLPFNDKTFDIIHCSHVIEHLDSITFYNTISEFDRCLKPNGLLILSAPLMWEGFYNDLSHVRPYTPAVICKYLGIDSNSGNFTNTKISNSYKTLNLHFRYSPELKNIKFYNTKNDIFVKIFLWALRRLVFRGLETYSKTGFTIVLRKL